MARGQEAKGVGFDVPLTTVRPCLWFPAGSDGKACACGVGDPGLIPASGRFSGEGIATHCSILAWKILWTTEHGRLQSMGSQRGGHNWATSLSFLCLSGIHWPSDLRQACDSVVSAVTWDEGFCDDPVRRCYLAVSPVPQTLAWNNRSTEKPPEFGCHSPVTSDDSNTGMLGSFFPSVIFLSLFIALVAVVVGFFCFVF